MRFVVKRTTYLLLALIIFLLLWYLNESETLTETVEASEYYSMERTSFKIDYKSPDSAYLNPLKSQSSDLLAPKLESNPDVSKVEPETKLQDKISYIIIIDGEIFRLQKGKPKGISVVWKNLIPQIAGNFPAPHKVIFVDRTPGEKVSKELKTFKNVLSVEFHENPTSFLQNKIFPTLKKQEEGKGQGVIIVFFSTYYDFPLNVPHICNIMMVHDVIPERVGIDHGPGSEYYPRIDATQKVDSIISISNSTSRDLLSLYKDKVIKNPTDEFYNQDDDPNPVTRNTVISTIPNRISRDIFPGPSNSSVIMKFRTKYNIFSVQDPLFRTLEAPIDYFVTVGSSYHYKNFDTIVKAIGLLPPYVIDRVSFVMTGRTNAISEDERKQLSKYNVIITTDEGTKKYSSAASKSNSTIRIRYLSYINEKDLATLYSGAISLIYISSWEGFGLPIAEALSSGTLAITTNVSSMPEVAGPDSFYVNNPRNAEELCSVIIKVANMTEAERQRRINNSYRYVEQFGGGEGGVGHGWDEMARMISDHIRGKKHRRSHCYKPYYELNETL